MAAGQLKLGLALGGPGPSGPLPITSSRMGHLMDALECAYRVLGLEDAAPVKRNRFIALDGTAKSVNRELEAKARDLAGIKGYVSNLAACPDGLP